MSVNEKLFRLDGKVAIVTGGGGGICGAICQAFANVGARVACLDYDLRAAQETVDTIRAAGGEAIAVECDVSSETSTLAAVARVVAELGKPAVLVNGAAILDKTGTILDIDLKEWNHVIGVNLTGAFLMSRAVLPQMIEAGGGSIIHIASMHGSVGRGGRVSYTTAKGGMLQLSKTMAIDHAAQGIRVNTLSPGAVKTRRITFRYGENAEAKIQQAATKYLLNRFAEPDELASAALFLASDASSYMTGSDLLVDGGYCAV
jgi:NAD(P)-dependent dehydrogenase (short-subunit alcohol dehydrogenase family)